MEGPGSGAGFGLDLGGSNGKVNVLLCSDVDFTERFESETPVRAIDSNILVSL